jgi:periplasmic divalent cation tolerance protein
MNRVIVVLCTCPDKVTAESIANKLIEQKLAACINILPGIRSIYRWQDSIEQADEYLIIIKTNQAMYAPLESAIRTHHPYEIPEIIALPVEQGLPEYLTWITACLA